MLLFCLAAQCHTCHILALMGARCPRQHPRASRLIMPYELALLSRTLSGQHPVVAAGLHGGPRRCRGWHGHACRRSWMHHHGRVGRFRHILPVVARARALGRVRARVKHGVEHFLGCWSRRLHFFLLRRRRRAGFGRQTYCCCRCHDVRRDHQNLIRRPACRWSFSSCSITRVRSRLGCSLWLQCGRY